MKTRSMWMMIAIMFVFVSQSTMSAQQPAGKPTTKSAQSDVTVTPEQKARLAVDNAFRQDPQLHGAWIIPAAKRYEFRVFLDPSRQEQQLEIIRKLLAENYPAVETRIVQTVSLPVARMVADLNREFETSRDWDGCFIETAYFERGAPYVLKMIGRVANDAQPDIIRSYIDRYRQANPAWASTRNELAPDTKSMTKMSADEARGVVMFTEGLDAFRHCRFQESELAFRQAIVELPSLVEYRYWRVLSLQRQGLSDEASAAMFASTKRDNGRMSEDSFRRVHWSLERIQGAERRQLLALERQARADFYSAKLRGNNSQPAANKAFAEPTLKNDVAEPLGKKDVDETPIKKDE